MTVLECFERYTRQMTNIHFMLSVLPSELVPGRVLKAWEVGGLLTPAYTEKQDVADLWLNVIAHQVVAGRLAYRLTSALQQKYYLQPAEAKDIVEAVLVHDFHKRLEVGKIRSHQKVGQTVSAASSTSAIKSASLLTGLAFSTTVIYLVEATGTNGVELMLFGEPTLGHKLVFYCGDCCVSGDQIMPYRQRFEAARIQYQSGGRYAGQDEEFIRKYGQGVIDTYFLILEPLQQELAVLLNFPGDPDEIPMRYS